MGTLALNFLALFVHLPVEQDRDQPAYVNVKGIFASEKTSVVHRLSVSYYAFLRFQGKFVIPLMAWSPTRGKPLYKLMMAQSEET